MLRSGWVNLYKSGHWHKCGKPGTLDLHAGDVYPTEVAARSHIERPDLWVACVPVQWSDGTQQGWRTPGGMWLGEEVEGPEGEWICSMPEGTRNVGFN